MVSKPTLRLKLSPLLSREKCLRTPLFWLSATRAAYRADEIHHHTVQRDNFFQDSASNFSEVQDWLHNLVTVESFSLISKGAIKGLIMIAIGPRLESLQIFCLVSRLPNLFHGY